MKKGLLLLFMLFSIAQARSQVLISLIFGDKLNSPFLEFGLEGGLNLSDISGLESSGTNPGFNLGFYFDFRSKKNPAWMINTGVIVKSPMGAHHLPVYSLDDVNLDNTFEGGSVNREIRYFNVPILIKYQFKNRIYLKTGPQFGLLASAFDEFTNEINKNDVTYKKKIRDEIRVIDAGIALGTGYHMNIGNGLNITIQYYYGLVPVMKGDGPNVYNRSLYLTAGIPIGKGKAAQRRAEKNAEMNKVILPEDKN
ncbi:porin family protein [Flavobacterium sp. S87F.05.LMB.W.Kidney.N]|uniref:porin family protein n=1 Tax=Flavobacterium sp. S87F.05.LMB.W.Kidney.N TaxID=1278758 RepID=UPI001064E937|nr:porin family protein [Flavobacterium sp. S87F.05.LMB.W.Kidney.N]TDX10661.1 outer membrane protein with beta-barrel domain [Flavobacterium sp. S87F.05.LMB.W.Kidney.N]